MARRSRTPPADICEPCWRSADGGASVHVRIRRASDPEIIIVRDGKETAAPIRIRALELGRHEVERIALAVGDALAEAAPVLWRAGP